MAHLEKCLPQKPEDPSSDAQKPYEKPGTEVHICNPSTGQGLREGRKYFVMSSLNYHLDGI